MLFSHNRFGEVMFEHVAISDELVSAFYARKQLDPSEVSIGLFLENCFGVIGIPKIYEHLTIREAEARLAIEGNALLVSMGGLNSTFVHHMQIVPRGMCVNLREERALLPQTDVNGNSNKSRPVPKYTREELVAINKYGENLLMQQLWEHHRNYEKLHSDYDPCTMPPEPSKELDFHSILADISILEEKDRETIFTQVSQYEHRVLTDALTQCCMRDINLTRSIAKEIKRLSPDIQAKLLLESKVLVNARPNWCYRDSLGHARAVFNMIAPIIIQLNRSELTAKLLQQAFQFSEGSVFNRLTPFRPKQMIELSKSLFIGLISTLLPDEQHQITKLWDDKDWEQITTLDGSSSDDLISIDLVLNCKPDKLIQFKFMPENIAHKLCVDYFKHKEGQQPALCTKIEELLEKLIAQGNLPEARMALMIIAKENNKLAEKDEYIVQLRTESMHKVLGFWQPADSVIARAILRAEPMKNDIRGINAFINSYKTELLTLCMPSSTVQPIGGESNSDNKESIPVAIDESPSSTVGLKPSVPSAVPDIQLPSKSSTIAAAVEKFVVKSEEIEANFFSL